MKKLLPTIVIASFMIKANAQIPLTKELTCTEEAFTVRLNLHSGRHPGMVRIGNAQLASYAVTPAIDYLPINDNISKSKMLGSSFFHSDSKPALEMHSLLFDEKLLSDFGLFTKPVYKYRDSTSFLHNYK
ncbi:hypothetical protein [Mucilaginibacter sp. BT774]|uniref:hypothetical protein n=1 Tax=Mucilaginibacter sp. BT774 TaxID=3062276 RepID=UPI0026761829|nr:hypothetical protein [Mucilaginibacter sp. BT774]MDO3627570.1 hypothetical protein [Mucilaginibacter sp. BT774]